MARNAQFGDNESTTLLVVYRAFSYPFFDRVSPMKRVGFDRASVNQPCTKIRPFTEIEKKGGWQLNNGFSVSILCVNFPLGSKPNLSFLFIHARVSPITSRLSIRTLVQCTHIPLGLSKLGFEIFHRVNSTPVVKKEPTKMNSHLYRYTQIYENGLLNLNPNSNSHKLREKLRFNSVHKPEWTGAIHTPRIVGSTPSLYTPQASVSPPYSYILTHEDSWAKLSSLSLSEQQCWLMKKSEKFGKLKEESRIIL